MEEQIGAVEVKKPWQVQTEAPQTYCQTATNLTCRFNTTQKVRVPYLIQLQEQATKKALRVSSWLFHDKKRTKQVVGVHTGCWCTYRL